MIMNKEIKIFFIVLRVRLRGEQALLKDLGYQDVLQRKGIPSWFGIIVNRFKNRENVMLHAI